MEKLKKIVENAKNVNSKEEFENSIKVLEKEITINPSNNILKNLFIDLLLSYGFLLSDEYQPNYDKAIQIFNRIINLNPKSHRAYYNLGMIYFELKQFKKSLKFYKKALKLKPDYKYAHYNIGLLFESKNKFKKALKNYEKALKIDEGFSYALEAKKQIQKKIEQNKLK
ncbi:MAG: tetratricopeptide repeat protein [Candidatus Lokiarchaeota archaeon]